MTKLAINGGEPVRKEEFPGWPFFGEEERKNLLDVFDSGGWSSAKWVERFEQEFAEFQDAKHGIACNSGTMSLAIALIGAGIGAGDEVLVPPYTFVASVSCILKVNAVPIFVDVDPDTFNLDAEKVEAAITDKTKAILPVHFAGLPADMDRLNEIAEKHGLKIIEDAAHAWGTKWNGKGAGALGDAGGFSFQMSKNITSGEGGIVLTDDDTLAAQARGFRDVGRGLDDPWYGHFLLGVNLRMTGLQAAILCGQLGRLEGQVLAREQNGKLLDEGLGAIDGVQILRSDDRCTRRSYHLYCCRFDEEAFDGLTREQFFKAVQAEGVFFYGGYSEPLYKQSLFQKSGDGPSFCPISCPYYGKKVDYASLCLEGAETVCKTAMWLRQSILLGSEQDMQDIIDAAAKVRENVDEARKL